MMGILENEKEDIGNLKIVKYMNITSQIFEEDARRLKSEK